jgi:hypothetical protein
MTSGAKNKKLVENLNENVSHLGTPLGLLQCLEKIEKKLDIVTQSKEGSFVCFVTENGQHFP